MPGSRRGRKEGGFAAPPFAARACRAALLMAGLLVGLAGSAGVARAEGPPLPWLRDARQEAAPAVRSGQPLLILFSMPDCSYCPDVRDNYLRPLAREASAKPGSVPVVREVDITSTEKLLDFEGKAVESRQFSRRYQVKATPTVLLLDERGQPLAQPLVGAGMAGFYGAYLDSALETARQKLKARGGNK